MELRQLEYFVAVADEQNFTRAAQRLRVAQPGVSAQIRQLERELGGTLLDRSNRLTRLTPAGAAVLPFARAALGAAAAARQAVDEVNGLLRGHVAVGMVAQCVSLDIPELLARFHERHPDIEITLTEDNSSLLADGVRDGTYDLAFIGLGAGPVARLGIQVVSDEPVVAAVADTDPLAGSESVPLEAIANRALITLSPGAGLRAAVDDAYASAGLTPRVAFEASDPRMLARLAARGLGLAFVPASVARAHGGGLHAVAVHSPAIRGRLALAWRQDGPPGPAARALIAHARSTYPPPAPEAGPGSAELDRRCRT
jgi:DNA-binding transcriptional LysR family regulator